MNARRFTAVILACGFAVAAEAVVQPFSRYEVILRRRPFGEPPPPVMPDAAGQSIKPPPPPAAREWRLCSLTRSEKRGITVGLVNIRTQASHLIKPGEKVDDIEVVEVDFDGESVKVRISGTEDWLAMDGKGKAGVQATASAVPVSSVASPSRTVPLSYADRLKARREEKASKHREVAGPALTGEQLEGYLKRYQMDAIRQGLPALPIPLTKEMDDQLVSEGVLPPQ